jgi:hypothetical protein
MVCNIGWFGYTRRRSQSEGNRELKRKKKRMKTTKGKT